MFTTITAVVALASVIVAQPTAQQFVDVEHYCGNITEVDNCVAEFPCYLDDVSKCQGSKLAAARLNDAACYPKQEAACTADPRCFFENARCYGADDMLLLHTENYIAIEQEGVEIIPDAMYTNVTTGCRALDLTHTCLTDIPLAGLCFQHAENHCVAIPKKVTELNKSECVGMDVARCVSSLHCNVTEDDKCEPSDEVALIGYGGTGGEGEESY